jgi:hypothetical protein
MIGTQRVCWPGDPGDVGCIDRAFIDHVNFGVHKK